MESAEASEKALHVLRVYADRGRRALELISFQDNEALYDVLKLRKVALRNFEQIEAHSQESVNVPRELASEIEAVNRQLDAALRNLALSLNRELHQLKRNRSQLVHFKSGQSVQVSKIDKVV